VLRRSFRKGTLEVRAIGVSMDKAGRPGPSNGGGLRGAGRKPKD
jgi:hypothetical protein